ncbi:MAG: hypothetical protein AAFY20_27220 [Cyanobacteria bacterium J06639_14]
MLQTYLATIAIQCDEDFATIPHKYEQLEKVRELARQQGLLAQEEARPVAVALFGRGTLIVNLGLEQPQAVTPDWYTQSGHNYWSAIAHVLDELVQGTNLQQLELLISSGKDPLPRLQVGLDRQIFSVGPNVTDRILPSELGDRLQTQRIYTFSRHSPND